MPILAYLCLTITLSFPFESWMCFSVKESTSSSVLDLQFWSSKRKKSSLRMTIIRLWSCSNEVSLLVPKSSMYPPFVFDLLWLSHPLFSFVYDLTDLNLITARVWLVSVVGRGISAKSAKCSSQSRHREHRPIWHQTASPQRVASHPWHKMYPAWLCQVFYSLSAVSLIHDLKSHSISLCWFPPK